MNRTRDLPDTSVYTLVTARLSSICLPIENSALHTIPGTYFPFWNNVTFNLNLTLNLNLNLNLNFDDNDNDNERGLETQHASSPRYVSVSFFFFLFYICSTNILFSFTTGTKTRRGPRRVETRLNDDFRPRRSPRRVKTRLNRDTRPRQGPDASKHVSHATPRCGRGGRDEDTGPNNETLFHHLALGAFFFLSDFFLLLIYEIY